MWIFKGDIESFERLQNDVDETVRALRHAGEPGKAYEGTWGMIYEGVETDSEESEHWIITLDCYLIGPHRHYTWVGETMKEALRKCEDDVRGWIAEAMEE